MKRWWFTSRELNDLIQNIQIEPCGGYGTSGLDGPNKTRFTNQVIKAVQDELRKRHKVIIPIQLIMPEEPTEIAQRLIINLHDWLENEKSIKDFLPPDYWAELEDAKIRSSWEIIVKTIRRNSERRGKVDRTNSSRRDILELFGSLNIGVASLGGRIGRTNSIEDVVEYIESNLDEIEIGTEHKIPKLDDTEAINKLNHLIDGLAETELIFHFVQLEEPKKKVLRKINAEKWIQPLQNYLSGVCLIKLALSILSIPFFLIKAIFYPLRAILRIAPVGDRRILGKGQPHLFFIITMDGLETCSEGTRKKTISQLKNLFCNLNSIFLLMVPNKLREFKDSEEDFSI